MLYVLVLSTDSIPSTTFLIITGSEKNTRFRRLFVPIELQRIRLKQEKNKKKTHSTATPVGEGGSGTLFWKVGDDSMPVRGKREAGRSESENHVRKLFGSCPLLFQATDKLRYVWFSNQVAEIGEKSMAALHRVDESIIAIPSEIEETMVCILRSDQLTAISVCPCCFRVILYRLVGNCPVGLAMKDNRGREI